MRRTSRIIATICILVLSASATARKLRVPAEYPAIEAANAELNVIQEWVARYNGPGDADDSASAIAVDSGGNIYVTGESYSSATKDDFVTIKYAPDSNQPLWVARYNGPADSTDEARAIAVDSDDNIYVTGHARKPGTNRDYVTLKYSPDSNQPVWVARYEGIHVDGDDAAGAVAVDSNDNIYVTGGSGIRHGAPSHDYCTIKYSADSNQPVWVARYNGPDNANDDAYAIALDSKDNIYVTGRSKGSGTYYDYCTIKYSPDSNQAVWVARYNGPANGYDGAVAVAVDSDDNIYVTGESWGYGDDPDYTTIKYSPESNEPLWVARYNGPADRTDSAYAIAVDSADNIYVTGGSVGSGTQYDCVTIKYSADSNQPLWVARYNNPNNRSESAEAIAIDSHDYVCVAGSARDANGDSDYLTIIYAPDSNEPVWVDRYNGPGNDNDYAFALAVDSDDAFYVTGRSPGAATGDDYATIKYSQPYLLPLEAEINIRPKTFNLQGKGKRISCRISLPDGYNVADIDPNSILLEEEIAPDRVVLYGRLAVAKFSRSAVQQLLSELQTPGEVELLVSGQLNDGTIFEGSDTIRIVGPERKLTLRRRVGR
jgi:uncharacterized delta-60 repeat protein